MADSGWDTYSKLVLQQLETMATGIDALRTELQDVKNQLTELKAKEDRVQDLKAWKEKMDDVASPPQLKTALDEIENLKTEIHQSMGWDAFTKTEKFKTFNALKNQITKQRRS